MNILYIGTSKFAVKPLEYLLENNFNVVAVVTQSDKLGGRGRKQIKSPVKKFAENYEIKILQPENINCDEIVRFINTNKINIGVVVSYGQIIKDFVFSLPDFGMINIHPSLLPKYRGPSPIQSVLLNGEKKTGVSVIEITDKMDAGPVLYQEEADISLEDNYYSLHDRLSEKGAEMLVSSINLLKEGKCEKVFQDNNQATYCHIITKDKGLINWKEPAKRIHDKIRAFVEWPVAYSFFKGKMIKFYLSEFYENNEYSNFTPGTIVKLSKKSFGIVCGDGILLKILKIQLQGKKILNAADFLNGMKIETGEYLG